MKNTIKKFVKQTLGCKCPDDVFEHIELERNVHLINDILLYAKINIGNRLLIYILEVSICGFLKDNMSAIVSYGKEERDRKGFNRFRLVLASEKDEGFEQSVRALFNGIKNRDDRIHLHIVDDLPWRK
jgi:hypothetical protein